MAKILFVYSTTDGHTVKIFSHLQGVVDDHEDQTEPSEDHQLLPVAGRR